MRKEVVPPRWDTGRVAKLIHDHGHAFARVKTPRGWITDIRKALGPTKHQCFARCLQLSSAFPEHFWYCEGFANGVQHAWLSPISYAGQVLDETWAIDPTWIWKSPKFNDGLPLEDIEYFGIRVNGRKAVDWLLNRARMANGVVSASLLTFAGQWDIEDFT